MVSGLSRGPYLETNHSVRNVSREPSSENASYWNVPRMGFPRKKQGG